MHCPPVSNLLKTYIGLLVFATVSHIIGLSKPSWAIINMSDVTIGTLGLWKLCSCYGITDSCPCLDIDYEPDWLKAVQAMEILGLVGLVICGFATFAMLINQSNRRLKQYHIFTLISSCIWILVGVIVFGCKTNTLVNFYGQIEDVDIDGLDLQISAGVSLVLSTIAATVGLLVCLPILITDSKTHCAQEPRIEDQNSCQVQTRGAHASLLIQFPPRHSEVYITPEYIRTHHYPVGCPQGCVASIDVVQPPPYSAKPPQYSDNPCKNTKVQSSNIPISVKI